MMVHAWQNEEADYHRFCLYLKIYKILEPGKNEVLEAAGQKSLTLDFLDFSSLVSFWVGTDRHGGIAHCARRRRRRS